MKNVQKNDGATPKAKKTPIQKAAEQKDATTQRIVTKEQFRGWAEKDFHAARAFLNLIATRPHILEEVIEELYKTTVLQNKKDD